jgi:hypothetical protein
MPLIEGKHNRTEHIVKHSKHKYLNINNISINRPIAKLEIYIL